MKQILILGSKGMLGQMVLKYFQRKDYKVEVINEHFDEDNFQYYMDKINSLEASIVINCIGRIKQKSNNTLDLLWSNTILPLELCRTLDEKHFLIHPSTDCIFDGNSSADYELSAKHSAVDIYGWSKSLAEVAVLTRANSLIVRVSIIGPDVNSNKGLLSWFLNLPEHTPVNGFTDHFWNGITTLEWCKRVEEFLLSDQFNFQGAKIIQLGTNERYTKYEMLISFQKIFKTNISISPFDSGASVNRCLSPTIYSSSLEDQLKELYTFEVERSE